MTEPFPYAVVVTDLDGTLLSPSSTVTARSRAVLSRLSQAGVYIVLATGRIHSDVASILYNMHLPQPGYLVTSGGARVHLIGSKQEEKGTTTTTGLPPMELIVERDVEPEVVCDLLQMIPPGETEINIYMYQGDDWKCTLDWHEELENYKDSGLRYTLVDPQELVQEYQEYLKHQKEEEAKGGVTNNGTSHRKNPLAGMGKVAFLSDNVERLHALERDILQKYPKRVEVVFSATHCLDVCGAGVTKRSAIEALLRRLPQQNGAPLTMANCIVFGDGMNDKEMLAAGAKGCVMGNANPRLKALLPQMEVIGTNAEDGVAKKLEEVFKLE
ncbi:hydrolase [Trypanosoma theileri]|uniref:Hydrolase n=1 Tax=Trypanosoma theileri TaxID=67003 RepID=A0A1X0NYN3_9TRYP|nr:hydrolase [Trypanosoma theileri]ORC89804.1 hydrolase [Trypanosoma theileri]